MELSPFLFGLYKLAKVLIYPYTWLCLLIGALTLLVLLPRSPRRQRWGKILTISACVLVFVPGTPFVASTLVALLEGQVQPFDRSGTQRFDAIVVLAGGVGDRGTLRPTIELSNISIRRTMCGIELLKQGWAPRLLLSGGDASVFGHGPQEAVEMKLLALQLNVPESAILVETTSRNTYEHAIQAKRILADGALLIVTSASHLPRALALFRKQGFEAVGHPCGYRSANRAGDLQGVDLFDFIPSAHALAGTTNALIEIVGTVVYWAVGRL